MADEKKKSETGFFDWFTMQSEPTPTPVPAPKKKKATEEEDMEMLYKMSKGKR